jgi:hypothetical protein
VHIIQLKVLTCIRVGNKQKKIDISIPKLDSFIHKVYIHVARKVYTNVYLFEKNVTPLQSQKNSRELEIIIQECILIAIRESIPTEDIIKAYMDESIEQEEEVVIENIEEPVLEKEGEPSTNVGGVGGAGGAGAVSSDDISSETNQSVSEPAAPPMVPSIKNIDENPTITKLSFNDYDSVMNDEDRVESVNAPKTIERLEEISTERAIQRKLEEDDDLDSKIKIHTDNISLDYSDVLDIEGAAPPMRRPEEEVLLDDIEELY